MPTRTIVGLSTKILSSNFATLKSYALNPERWAPTSWAWSTGSSVDPTSSIIQLLPKQANPDRDRQIHDPDFHRNELYSSLEKREIVKWSRRLATRTQSGVPLSEKSIGLRSPKRSQEAAANSPRLYSRRVPRSLHRQQPDDGREGLDQRGPSQVPRTNRGGDQEFRVHYAGGAAKESCGHSTACSASPLIHAPARTDRAAADPAFRGCFPAKRCPAIKRSQLAWRSGPRGAWRIESSSNGGSGLPLVPKIVV